ncbi:metallophosphoesterase [Microbulbifer sp. MCCC 1A16149]|uniref:metallophosphoesterase n=1 Tax=Microbulbifer sp. MCCC 1A16149 TaxID=3411322 RepID=UPI003D123589
MTTYLQVEQNPSGRDFVVGDVHGHLNQLQSQLEDVDFSPGLDRLFFLGDIIDRGPDSSALIQLIDNHTYFSVLGNHEAMMIAAHQNPDAVNLHQSNGGEWFYRLSDKAQEAIVDKVCSWPWAIELDTYAQRVGLIHADVPESSWPKVVELLKGVDDAWLAGATFAAPKIAEVANALLWGRSLVKHLYHDVLDLGPRKRTRFEYMRMFLDRIDRVESVSRDIIQPFNIEGIDAVFIGHSYVPVATKVGNCQFLDTYRGDTCEVLSLICINSI